MFFVLLIFVLFESVCLYVPSNHHIASKDFTSIVQLKAQESVRSIAEVVVVISRGEIRVSGETHDGIELDFTLHNNRHIEGEMIFECDSSGFCELYIDDAMSQKASAASFKKLVDVSFTEVNRRIQSHVNNTVEGSFWGKL